MESRIKLIDFISLSKQLVPEKITLENISEIDNIRNDINEIFELLDPSLKIRKTALQILLSNFVDEKIKQLVNLTGIATINTFCEAIIAAIRQLKSPEAVVDELQSKNLKEFIDKADEVYRYLRTVHITLANQEIYSPILDKLMVRTFYNRVPNKNLKEHLLFHQDKSWTEFRACIPNNVSFLESRCYNCNKLGHYARDCFQSENLVAEPKYIMNLNIEDW